MAKKFLVVIAVIAAAMAALAIIPAVLNPPAGLALDYSRERIVLTDGAYLGAGRETLRIKEDGAAQYARLDANGNQVVTDAFRLDSGEIKVLKELFIATGFMQIPSSDYDARPGLANYTSYQLAVESAGQTKSFRWVNPEAADGAVPSIIVNAGTRLDEILKRYS